MEVVSYVRQHQHEHVGRETLATQERRVNGVREGGFPNDAIPSLQTVTSSKQ